MLFVGYGRRTSTRLQSLVRIVCSVSHEKVSNKRRRSFNVALHCHDHEVVSLTDDAGAMERQRLPGARAKLAYFLAEEFSPGDDPEARKYYSLQYKCWPPPLFIPSVTLLQVLFFVYYSLSAQEVPVANGPLPIDSLMIFRSDKREEIWRFLFYALVHAGWWHLIFNLTVQLLIGLPLEMVHGSGRIAFVYLSGVVAGSLAASVFDPDVYLVGGSGGVYALLAAHVANVFLNFAHIDCGLCWVVVSVFVASCDVAFAIWDRYVRVGPLDHPVSYAAHLSGATAGLTLGFLLLKSFDQRPSRQWVWWLALTVYFTLMFSAIVWNLIVV
uniref:rhomboid protease n=1 Tax=Plectus sambesii TaxID=2011161 RepID=A0A914XP94_9BILA